MHSPSLRLRSVRVLALSIAVFGLLVGLPAAAAAQEQPEEVAPTSVTVTYEPGVCVNQGSLCERVFDWTGNEALAETAAWLLGTPLTVLALIGAGLLVNRLVRRAIRHLEGRLGSVSLTSSLLSERAQERSKQRAHAVGALLRSAASTLIFGTTALMVLGNIGVNILPLLASLGIAGIAIGFGAQTLVEDLISGVILILEDQLGPGDRVDVGVVEGDVERLTLRSTVILARNGVRWYVPNSEIRRVGNESQHKARAEVQIGVAYGTDLAAAARSFREAAETLAEEPMWGDAGIEDIRAPFVAELADSAIVLELRLFVTAVHRRPLERALRQRLVEVAEAKGINVPFPQMDVWMQPSAA